MKKEILIDHLSKIVSEKRFALFQQVLDLRTRYMTVVLEDIYQPHNASAVLRTCDCFGVQDVHIIENQNEYMVNPDVALGASKWLDMKNYNSLENNTLQAIESLKKQGYRIVATTPHTDDVNLDDFDLNAGKFALVFGTEMRGISELMKENADEFLKIPMQGFTESFNISVSAAIAMHHLSWKLRNSNINWRLPQAEKDEVLLNWLKSSIKKSDLIEEEFYRRHSD